MSERIPDPNLERDFEEFLRAGETVPRTVADRLAEALETVIKISDRKHEAWDEAKAALAEYRKAVADGK